MRVWKSLGERRGLITKTKAEFDEDLPVGESVRQISRRDFFRFSGVGFAAGLALGCKSKVVEKAMPYLNATEGLTPGVAEWYATTCGGCSAACGILARSRDGRPVKLEGNPDHPHNQGGLCAIGQAQTRGLYDSARLRGPRMEGQDCSWAALDADLAQRLAAVRASGGRVRVLSGTLISPTLRGAVQDFLAGFKDGKHVVFDALSCAAIPAAYERTHGARVLPRYRLEEADVILALEADFLGTWIDPAGFTRAYASRRGPDNPRPMSRHIQVESGLSLTGSNADERIRVAPSERVPFLEAMRAACGEGRMPVGLRPGLRDKAVAAAHDLQGARGQGLVLCGANDLDAQILTARINHLLGHEGRTIDLENPGLQKQGDDGALGALIKEMAAGEVAALLLLETNPAYELPPAFAAAFTRVGLRVDLSLTLDESAVLCTHLAPVHHWLESWSDAEAVRGTLSLRQPLVQPLFGTREALESLLAWSGRPQSALEQLQARWRREVFPRQQAATEFDAFWAGTLQKGVVQVEARGTAPAYRAAAAPESRPERAGEGGYELLLYAKAGQGDGRHAFNPWLQELPDPVTKLTWDNYVSVSPTTARKLGLEQGDLAGLRPEGLAELMLPVVVQPGQDDRTLAVALGYGRRLGGPKDWKTVGGNAFPWRSLATGFLAPAMAPLQIRRAGGRVELAATQDHHSLEGRELVREMPLAAYLRDPASARPHEQPGPSAYADHPHGKHRWAMVIDLSKCTGCSGCVIGCQVENNIPVVGREEVAKKREMHWLRIDRYYEGSEAEPKVLHQPMLCQQCDNAPCENVCPVLATVHSEEGLNQQVYNRCVGTRYCANNCPYKVRRFNWWEYPHSGEIERLALNPDVTVRSRGVMEKCSFCVQRLMAAKLQAKDEGRELRDGEAAPACMQSCPGQAIVFGDTNDPGSRISRVMRDPKRFLVLGELGIGPAVSYLTRIRNAAPQESKGGHHGA